MDLNEIKKMHDEHTRADELPWRAWGSWFSWGSPIGFGFFIIALGVFVVLLHMAGLWH